MITLFEPMGRIGFYFFYAVNWIVTLLPLGILYLFSDALFLLLYYYPGYRRKVVSTNLRNAFPDKTPEERKVIEKKFYRHLADLFVETLKLTHLSNKQLLKRFIFTNPGLINRLFKEDRDVAVVLSHYNNWEWLGTCLPLYTLHKNISIYKPLQNKLFNQFLNKLRSRNNLGLVTMSGILREIITNRRKNEAVIYGFIADQTPPLPDIRYWTTFLNQDTPVYLGPERLAAKFDMYLVFFNVQKVKRGYYTFTAETLFEHTNGLPEHWVTDSHVKRLEEIIREKPEYWIWSHRRWKHKKPSQND